MSLESADLPSFSAAAVGQQHMAKRGGEEGQRSLINHLWKWEMPRKKRNCVCDFISVANCAFHVTATETVTALDRNTREGERDHH